MDTLLALVGFSFVSAVTPGPNNILLWASGAAFGFLATSRHVLGTALGIGAMALVAAAGVGELLTLVPGLELVLKLAASGYLLYLALRIAGARALERTTMARPLGLVGAAAFQAVNPKAWIFVLGAVTAFRPEGLSLAAGTLATAGTMTLVVIPASALWAAGGGLIGGLFRDDRAARLVSLVLAVLLAVSVISIWN
jgi:threonine/homoserine/homoserine lactone efflux protein